MYLSFLLKYMVFAVQFIIFLNKFSFSTIIYKKLNLNKCKVLNFQEKKYSFVYNYFRVRFNKK